MDLRESLSSVYDRIRAAIHSSRGRDVLLYLLFVCVAFVFWLMLSLDSEVQRNYDVPLSIEQIPDSVTFITTPPASVNASVTAKGSQLLQYTWGRVPPLRLRFSDFEAGQSSWAVSQGKLESRVRDYFGNNVIINSIRPDSVRLEYTVQPGQLVAVRPETDIQPNLQCIISGPITTNVDSVKVYSIGPISESITSIATEPIVLRDLKDTTWVDVRLKPVAGLRFIPDQVKVMVPVEPLIAKRQKVRISVFNLPEGVSLITFPSEVELSYLVPMSRFNEDCDIIAIVDWLDVDSSDTHLPVSLSLLPPFVSSVSIEPESVEYIIEHH